MVIQWIAGDTFTCVSGDTKPTNVPAETRAIETNTDDVYRFNGTSWVLYSANDKTETLTNKTISGANNILPIGAYNQIVFKKGSTYYAANKDGDILNSSTTNPGAVIQTCIDLKGRTYVADGDYNFPSSGFSGINIGFNGTALDLGPNANFIVAAGYTGYVVKLERNPANVDQSLFQCRVSGGQYDETGGASGSHLWTALKVKGGPNVIGPPDIHRGVSLCEFRDIKIQYAAKGVHLDCSTTGFVNANTFQNILVLGTTVAYDFDQPPGFTSGTDIARDIFISCNVQHYTSSPTLYGFKDVRYKDHVFIGCKVWDQVTPATQKTMTIDGAAKNITLIGGILTRAGGFFVDNSKSTIIIGDEWNPPRSAGLSTTGHVFGMIGRKNGKMDCINATAGEGLLASGMATVTGESAESATLSTANGTCGRTRTTAASVGALAGSRYATSITCRQWNPIYRCMFKLNTTNGIRPFFGWASPAADLTGDDPLNALSGVILTARAADTNFQIASNNGSGATVFTDTGIAKDTAVNIFDLYADESATNKWKWALYSQATLRSIVSTIPAYTDLTTAEVSGSSTPIKPFFQIDSGDGGAKSFVQLQLYVESD